MNKIFEAIPVEVIVKYNETGQRRPLKFMFYDELYTIEKVFTEKCVQPPWGGYSAIEYSCLIKGQRRSLYFDKSKGKWFVAKIIETDIG
jgi:hypothetical protein